MLKFNQFISEARIRFTGQRREPSGRTTATHAYGRKGNLINAGTVETDYYVGPTGKKILHVSSFPATLDFPTKAKVTPHLASAARAVRRAMKVHKIDPKDPNFILDYGMDVRDIGGQLTKRLSAGLPRVFGKFKLPTPHDRGTHEDLGDLGLL